MSKTPIVPIVPSFPRSKGRVAPGPALRVALALGVAVAALAAGCHRIENPHPDSVGRESLLVCNYRIRADDGTFRSVDTSRTRIDSASQSFAAQSLRILVPRGHLPQPVIDAFVRASGATVETVEYEVGIATAYVTLSEDANVDAMLIPGILLQRLIEEDRVLKLSRRDLPNLAGLDEAYRTNRFDPDQVLSVPYLWSTAGIAFDFSRLDFTPGSWRSLFEPPTNEVDRIRGHVSLLREPAHALAPALILMGHSPYSDDPDALSRASSYLRERREFLGLRFVSIPPATALIDGEILVAQCYAGDVASAIAEDPRFQFVVPDDGTWERIEFLAISRGIDPSRIDLAHALLNFLLDPKMAGKVSTASYQGSTVPAAMAFLDANVKYGSAYARASHPYVARFNREGHLLRQRIWAELTNAAPLRTDP